MMYSAIKCFTDVTFEFVDRMIVRISLAMKGAIGPHFTEQESHSTHGILYRNVAEYLVVLRENRIELYRDYVRHFLQQEFQ